MHTHTNMHTHTQSSKTHTHACAHTRKRVRTVTIAHCTQQTLDRIDPVSNDCSGHQQWQKLCACSVICSPCQANFWNVIRADIYKCAARGHSYRHEIQRYLIRTVRETKSQFSTVPGHSEELKCRGRPRKKTIAAKLKTKEKKRRDEREGKAAVKTHQPSLEYADAPGPPAGAPLPRLGPLFCEEPPPLPRPNSLPPPIPKSARPPPLPPPRLLLL